MDDFELIKNYFRKIITKNPGALKLNDDVFFDKKKKLIFLTNIFPHKYML